VSVLREAYRALCPPLLVGHRGLRGVASENSLEAIAAAQAAGAHGVEIDVRPTREGTLVLMHDRTLARTAGGDARCVASLDDAALAEVRLAGGERIPSLAEALVLCADLGLFLNVELKRDVPNRLAACQRLAYELRGRTAPPLIVSSFDPLMLAIVRRLAPEMPSALLVAPERAFVRHLSRPLGAAALHPCRTIVSAHQLGRWREAGLRVMVWTVNDPIEAAYLLGMGVDGLISDDPASLRHLF
jgi:glycerophosphoryl diester phosphodiesterase